MPTYTRLKGITELGDSTLCDQLKSNMKMFFEWGLLGIGGFSNINLPTSGAYGGDAAILRCAKDRNYLDGRTWESNRYDWVWESGVDYSQQPISISGIYVNDTFYDLNTTGAFSYKVNYPLGRIIFNSPISTSSVVKVARSEKYFHFYETDEPWFKQILFGSHRVDDNHFAQLDSGVFNMSPQNRVQLPAIAIQTVPRRKFIPMQLGGGQYIVQDVLFGIISETSWDRDKILDIITYQKDKTIYSFDKNLMSSQDKFPLDYDGSLRSGAMVYPDMIKASGDNGFFWKTMLFLDFNVQEITDASPLFKAVVRGTIQIDFPEI